MEHKLLITPEIKSYARLLGIIRTKRIVQNRRFDFGVKIKNINDSSFNGCKIKNISINSVSQSYDHILSSPKEFSVISLNPEETVTIWLDNAICSLDGSFWFKLDIVPNNGEDKVTTYVWDNLNKIPINSKTDKWQDTIFITNESSITQTTTNYLLAILTVILLLDQLFGMKNIFKGLINVIIFILKFLTKLLSGLF